LPVGTAEDPRGDDGGIDAQSAVGQEPASHDARAELALESGEDRRRRDSPQPQQGLILFEGHPAASRNNIV